MRVLDTVTGLFVEIDPRPKDRRSKSVKYAILSHTWDSKGEQSYRQLRNIQKRHTPSDDDDDDNAAWIQDPLPNPTPGESLSPIWADPKLSPKIREACRIARENGYRYLWIDSCCIDKTSSSELSESINSMYHWYALADVCYTFLADVPPGTLEDHHRDNSCFRCSRWFTRGWTLQELIAPFNVIFLTEDWNVIGSKLLLRDLITEITKIHHDALLHVEPLEQFSVAQRFSWASRRLTTRVEDRAYSLLGILDINMATLYGEGERAFRRLQEEIMRRTPDQSIFAWTDYKLPHSLSDSLLDSPETSNVASYKKSPLTLHYVESNSSFLAPSLDVFSECEGIKALSHNEVLRRLQITASELPQASRHYDFTPYGVRLQLPVIHFESSKYFPPGCANSANWQKNDIPFSQWYLVILGCEHRDFPGRLLGQVCYIPSSGPNINFLFSGHIWDEQKHCHSKLLPVSPQTIMRLHSSHISPKMLYIPQPRQRSEGTNVRDARNHPHKTINLILPMKDWDALFVQGYTATLHGPDGDVHPTIHSVTLAHNTHTIAIDYQHSLNTNNRGNQTLDITAHVRTSIGVYRVSPDNQGTIVSWRDFPRWDETLDIQKIVLTLPERSMLLLLGLAFFTTDHYLLSIELKTANPSSFLPFYPITPITPVGPEWAAHIPSPKTPY